MTPHNRRGSMARFLCAHLVGDAHHADLPYLLEWTRDRLRLWRPIGSAHTLTNALLERCWPHRNRPELQQLVDDLVVTRTRWGHPWYDPPSGDELPLTNLERRALLMRLVPRVTRESRDWV
jgi:hypothetical protein